MINSENILLCINDAEADLSDDELMQIIDEQLNMPEANMDISLIELCLDAYELKYAGSAEGSGAQPDSSPTESVA